MYMFVIVVIAVMIKILIIIRLNLKMSHYNNISKEGAINKNNSNEIGSFEKSVMSNSR
jgi:hypothetical protein